MGFPLPRADRAAMLAFALVACPRFATADDRPSGPGGILHTKRLDNGMNVVVQEDHRVPLVALALRYDVGERAAPPGLAGVATLTTLLMLRATKHVAPGDYYRLLARAGATGIYDTTLPDATVLEIEVPTSRFELPFWLWSDQMGFFADGLDDAQIEMQRTAFESRQRVWFDATPNSRLGGFAEQELFPPEHPYSHARPGSPEEIHGIDRAAILAFHKAWITPEHATLVVVGDVVPSDAFALAERYFGPIPRPIVGQRVERPPPVKLPGEVQLDVAANVGAARVVIRWPTARFLTTEDGRLDVLCRLLGGFRSAWLYWKLADEMKIARDVYVHQYSEDLGSELEVNIEGAPGRSPVEILAAFDAVMSEIRTRRPTADAVAVAAYEVLVGRLVGMESIRTRAWSLAAYSAVVGTPDYLAHDFERYAHILPESLHDAIATWMPSDRRVVLLVTPDPKAPVGGERRARRFTPAGGP